MPVRSKNTGGGSSGGGSGGGSGNYHEVNDADYDVQADDFIIGVKNLSAERSIDLPDPTTLSPGKQFFIKDESGSASTFNIVVNTQTGTNLIDGQAFIPIIVDYGGLGVYTDGVEYYAM